MQRHRVSLAAVAAVTIALLVFAGCTDILGGFDVSSIDSSEVDGQADGAPVNPGGRANGEACGAAAECGSNFCVDGVCCESACDGVCESCGLAEKGTCQPVPDGTDPQSECAALPVPDGGAENPPPGEVPDGGDAGSVVLLPDGGVTGSDTACGGACNGARACAYPANEKTCGTKFCSGPDEAARLSCDGQGHCSDLVVEKCAAYTCETTECQKGCTGLDDCQSTHFCNSSGICQAKLGNGVPAVAGTQCQSGFVADGVCCNADCDQTPNGVCNTKGREGVCTCVVGQAACDECLLYYADADGDGFGDASGTLENGRAKIGCATTGAPAGFVGNKRDCADGDKRANPDQSASFDSPIQGTSTTLPYDFDCDGVQTKAIAEYPGESCHFCEPDQRSCVDGAKSCTSAGQGYLRCGKAALGSTCSGVSEGFVKETACGADGAYVSCGYCRLAIKDTPIPSSSSTKRQACR